MQQTRSISKSYLFKLSIPIFFSNIAIPFVGFVDTGLMGHLSSEKFLAAISVATSIMTMIFWSFGFLRMGTVGLISQSLGRKDWNEITQDTFSKVFSKSAVKRTKFKGLKRNINFLKH